MAEERAKTFCAEIILPDGVLYKENVQRVVFPADDGERAVLHGHMPFLCSLGSGKIRALRENDDWDHFEIKGGIAEVDDNGSLLFTSEKVNRLEKQ